MGIITTATNIPRIHRPTYKKSRICVGGGKCDRHNSVYPILSLFTDLDYSLVASEQARIPDIANLYTNRRPYS